MKIITKHEQEDLPNGFSAEPAGIPSVDKDTPLKIEKIQTQPEEIPAVEKSGKALFIFGSILSVLFFLATIALAVLYFKTQKNSLPVQSVLPTPTILITAPPKPNFLNSEITFEVLNASGVQGQAAKYGKQITEAGYSVKNLGNASGKLKGLTVLLSKELDPQKDSLMLDLIKIFPTASYSGTLTDSTYMARLIIGNP